MANISKNWLKRYDVIQTTNDEFELRFPYDGDPNPLVEDRLVLKVDNDGLRSSKLTKAANFTLNYDGISVTEPQVQWWDNTTTPTDPQPAGFKGDDRSPTKPTFTFNTEDSTGMYLAGAGQLAWSVLGSRRWYMTDAAIIPSTTQTYDIGESLRMVRDIYTNRLLAGANDATTPAISFDADLDTGFSSPNDDELLIVTGGVTRLMVNNAGLNAEVPILLEDGTETEPSLAFQDDLDTGIYSPVNGSLSITTDGVTRATFDTNLSLTVPIYGIDGTALAPTYSFETDTDTGMFSSGADVLSLSTGGTARTIIGTTEIRQRLRTMFPNGSVSEPSITFESDSDTGVYLAAENDVRFTIGGSDRLLIQNTDIISKVQILGPYQSSSQPTYSWQGNETSGMYTSGSDVRFAVNGSDILILTNSEIEATTRYLAIDGTSAVPSFSFTNDQDTGIFRPADDQFSISTGGSERILVTNTETTIRGNLTVQGTTTTVDSVNMTITDNIILLNKDEVGAGVSSGKAGIEIERGTLDNAGWYYDEANDWWGPTGPSGNFGVGVGATQTVGNVEEIDTRTSTDQSLYVDGVSIRMRGTGERGLATAPSYTWESDTDTGMYSPTADEVALTTGGTDRVIVSNTKITNRVPLNTTYGSTTVPAYSFEGDNDTGMYRSNPNEISFTAGGSTGLVISETNITFNDIILIPNGSAAAPGLAFASDTDTGVFRNPTTGGMSISDEGTEVVNFNSSNIKSKVQVQNQNGDATNPAYSFESDTNTGMYGSGADSAHIAAGGIEKVEINTTQVLVKDELSVQNDGVLVGNPVNGNLGPGTVNAEDIHRNGEQVCTVSESIAFAIVFGG